MDIEELNKFQLILLALLVSFVTSIATGIVTVTLLAQAPPAVTETVNHVIERTIQTIVPQATSTPVKQTTVTQTVVTQADDLLTSAIASALPKTGRVFQTTATSSPVVALAAEIAPNILVTDSAVVTKDHLVAIGGTNVIFTVSQTFPDVGVAILVPASTSTALSAPFKVGDAASVKLGATVAAVMSVVNERVAIGNVTSQSLLATIAKKGSADVPVSTIDTNVNAGAITGAPLIDIYGNLVGISTSASQSANGNGSFVSANDIISLLAAEATTTSASAARN
ncbi:MAG: hypothetical protein KGI73_00020 [Patescibacteria group bacterium]|nr:hypothetical protein [Patescibacteria group bacterium]